MYNQEFLNINIVMKKITEGNLKKIKITSVSEKEEGNEKIKMSHITFNKPYRENDTKNQY